MTVTRVMRTLARLVVLVAGIALLPAALAVERDPDSHFFMPFLGDLRDELGEARTDGRQGLLVMYHFEECPSCQRMRREVLNRPEVQDWYRRTFRPIAIDIRGAQPITDLNGKTQSERAYGRAVKIRGTPDVRFLCPRRRARLPSCRRPVRAGRFPPPRALRGDRRLQPPVVRGLPAGDPERKLK